MSFDHTQANGSPPRPTHARMGVALMVPGKWYYDLPRRRIVRCSRRVPHRRGVYEMTPETGPSFEERTPTRMIPLKYEPSGIYKQKEGNE